MIHIGFAAIILYQVRFFMRILCFFLQHNMLLGQISHDPLHPDFVPSIFAHVDVRSREKLKRKLDRYFKTTATKRKRLEAVARTVETPPGELCVALKCNCLS